MEAEYNHNSLILNLMELKKWEKHLQGQGTLHSSSKKVHFGMKEIIKLTN